MIVYSLCRDMSWIAKGFCVWNGVALVCLVSSCLFVFFFVLFYSALLCTASFFFLLFPSYFPPSLLLFFSSPRDTMCCSIPIFLCYMYCSRVSCVDGSISLSPACLLSMVETSSSHDLRNLHSLRNFHQISPPCLSTTTV